MGMTKTSVIRMLSAATKAADADSSIITLGCMIGWRAEKCQQQATPTVKSARIGRTERRDSNESVYIQRFRGDAIRNSSGLNLILRRTRRSQSHTPVVNDHSRSRSRDKITTRSFKAQRTRGAKIIRIRSRRGES